MSRTLPRLLLCIFISGSAFAQLNSVDAPRLFEKGMNALTGVGETHNTQTAMESLRRSAELGYAPAQVVLGYIYETASAGMAQDAGQAIEWYKKAAKQDDVVGNWLLGRAYYVGVGTGKDLVQAAAPLKRAAAQNDPFGEYLLGLVQLERNDYPGAASLFRKAAMQGLPQAQQQLGTMLKDGRGVGVDKSEAYVWLLLSARAGNTSVGADLALLEADLGSNKTEQAKSQAREMEASVARVVVAKGCTGWQGEFSAVPAPPPPDVQSFCR